MNCVGHLNYVDEHDIYVPAELVGQGLNSGAKRYYCYLLELERNFTYDIEIDNLMLAARNELKFDEGNNLAFELEVERGIVIVRIKYATPISLTSEEVMYLILLVQLLIMMTSHLFVDRQLFCC